MSDDVAKIAAGLSYVEEFTLKHIVGRRLIPWMSFELTSSEQKAQQSLGEKGLARRQLIGFGDTSLGIAVRNHLNQKGDL